MFFMQTKYKKHINKRTCNITYLYILIRYNNLELRPTFEEELIFVSCSVQPIEMIKKLIINIMAAFYSDGIRLGYFSNLNSNKQSGYIRNFDANDGSDNVTTIIQDSNKVCENNYKYNALQELKKEQQTLSHVNKEYIIGKIKSKYDIPSRSSENNGSSPALRSEEYISDNALNLLSLDNKYHSIAILFMDW